MKKTALLSGLLAILIIALTLGCGNGTKGKECIDTEAPAGLTATPAGGSYCATTVSLSASDGTIYYTLDGSGPTTGSPVYTGPIDISVDTTLKFMAVDACGNQTATLTEVYDIDDEAPIGLTASPAGGSYCATTINLTASDGTIYYTLDGSGPTTGSPIYIMPVDISSVTTLKFIAVDTCGNPSDTVTEVYDIDTEGPTSLVASPAEGSYCATTVSLTASDGTIYYTLDGSGPNTGSPIYIMPVDISSDTTLKFMAVDTCGNQSDTVTEVYYIDTEGPTSLVASPAGGSYCTTPVTVTLTASDGTIYYTLDGSGPTTSSPVYAGPIDIIVDTTLKAIAADQCGNLSGIIAEVYTIDAVANLTITYPENGKTIGTGNVRVTGTADDDIATAIVFSDQGHIESSGVDPGGNWSVTLTGVTVSSIFIAAIGTDDCGNTGTDSVTMPVSYIPPLCVWFVNDDATGLGTGTSWANAFTVVQDAVDMAISGEIICVAEGTYINIPTSTASVLTMKAGVDIYGGFTGTESYLQERGNPADHPTILDGEDTSCHVVIGASNARLDGFIVTGGNANGPEYDGSGMYNFGVTNIIVANCTFSNNSAEEFGGGMFNISSSLTITNCAFNGNSISFGGGGMYNWDSSPTITNCTFSGNLAGWGGGMHNADSSPEITNCTFSGNSTNFSGGGILNSNSSPTITNCIFSGNSADEGGGIKNVNSPSPEITNCTFVGNSALSLGGGMYNDWSLPMITNCILWGDTAPTGPEIYNNSSAPIVTYSDIKGGWPGADNINLNPLFVTGPKGNYYLGQTAAGQGSDSPCVDAGSDTAANLGLDDKTTRTDNVPDSGTVDMGYHYELYTIVLPCIWYVDADATGNNNGTSWVDAFTVVQDAVEVASWGEMVWVAEGTYTSDSPASLVLTMTGGVEIYGGFTGTETELSERGDPADRPTILDGEDASYHVVLGVSNARLDGFTVTGGNASGSGNSCGGGMYNYGVTSLVVANCIFIGNSANFEGGGMYNYESSPVITNCSFIGNSANLLGGGMDNITGSGSSPEINKCTFSGNLAMRGGGMYNGGLGAPAITNCTFSGNEASEGGGILNDISSSTITNCIFINNSAFSEGGGMDNVGGSSPVITNCTFISNSAIFGNGGGMQNWYSSPTISNCTFSDNWALDNGSGMYNYNSSPTIINCIMWDDTAPSGSEIALYSTALPSILTISYSDVQGGQASVYVDPGCTLNWGVGMIGDLPGDDPLFVTGPNGDYYLSQPPGQAFTSPCVNAGSDTAENLGLDDKATSTNGDLDTGIVDMGYHYEP